MVPVHGQAANRTYKGLEAQTLWQEPFCFATLADPQLGMMQQNQGWDMELENCRKVVDVCGSVVSPPLWCC